MILDDHDSDDALPLTSANKMCSGALIVISTKCTTERTRYLAVIINHTLSRLFLFKEHFFFCNSGVII